MEEPQVKLFSWVELTNISFILTQEENQEDSIILESQTFH